MGRKLTKDQIKADQALKVLTRQELDNLYFMCLNLSKEELLTRLEYSGITIFEEAVLRALVADMGRGEMRTIEKLTDRLFGKTVQPIKANLNVKTLEEIVAGADEIGSMAARAVLPEPDDDEDYEI